MKPNIIKKYLSYFKDVHLETISSDYNEELQVLLSKGRYQLCTPNAIYSFADKYDNFRDTFTQMDLDKPSIQNILILGFGMGSIPYMLEKTFGKHYTYTGIEIDDAVIYLASKYVMDDLASDVEIIQTDAWSYIQQSSVRYDLICIDIFVDDKIPTIFLSEEFLKSVQENICTTGLLIFNHLAFHESDIVVANRYFEQVFSKVFPNGHPLKVKSNIMMISDKNRLSHK